MNVDKVISELNLDGDDNEVTLITDLLDQAGAIIRNSVNHKVSADVYEADPMYQRAVITLATDLYYNRTLPGGLSLGIQMMVNNLKGVYADGTTTTTVKP